ncbi:MAG: hypothetical protein AAB289_10445, partial [Chloroflexota bacterium]
AAAPREPEDALKEVVRGRLEASGPLSAATLARTLGITEAALAPTLAGLEAEGFALQGRFTLGVESVEWCDRRLLARIHRYTLDRLRKEIEPVSAADFIRFLTYWHHVAPEYRLDGPTGLVAVLETLEGFEIPVSAWEDSVLPARLSHYNPGWLEQLCLSGELAWARLFPPADTSAQRSGATRATPVSLVFRDNLDRQLALRPVPQEERSRVRGVAAELLECLQVRGACFFQELVQRTRHLPVEVEEGLRELVAWGLVTCDGFTGLQSLTSPLRRQPAFRKREPRREGLSPRLAQKPVAGRWSHLYRPAAIPPEDATVVLEHAARALLRRYGVVFPRLLARESGAPPWRDLLRVYRRLEARGEIRGGRFVEGFTGEQYALAEAVQQVRAVRRQPRRGTLISLSAADPLNLIGIVTPGARVPAHPTNRVTYRDGVPVAGDPEAHGADVRYVGHLDAVKPVLTVSETLAFWAGLHGVPTAATGQAVAMALERLGIERLGSAPGKLLSAGQKRRVNLARLLL